jgi:hypothetical protein
VHSLSSEPTIKKANFGLRDLGFTGKASYNQWVFMATTARAAMQMRPPSAGTFGRPFQSR